jgi:hypothetical protein
MSLAEKSMLDVLAKKTHFGVKFPKSDKTTK